MAKKSNIQIKENSNTKYSSSYWGTEISNARKRHEDSLWREAEQSIRVYNTKFKLESVQRRVNVWWYIVQTLLPAYYSSTPKAEVDLRKQSGSQLLDLAAVALERNVQYSMDMDFNFDFVGLNSALQLLLTGRAVLWARKETDFGEKTPLVMNVQTDGIYLPDGSKYEGDLADLEEQKDGSLLYNLESIEKERGILESLHYTDYLNSDARNEEEVTWRSRQAFLSQKEVEDMFGIEMVNKLKFDSFPETSLDQKKGVRVDERNARDGKAALQEIWCEETGKVYWTQERGKNSIVESGDVPIDYPEFYPCSVINLSLDPDSTIPVSDYTHAKDQILEVERLAEKKHMLIQSISPNGIYDVTMGDPVQQLFTGFAKMIPVTNWPSHTAKGGAAARMEFLNISPYVEALQIVSQELEQAKQSLFQMLKVSDLLQGISDPRKTATANRLENAWSSLGLIVRQNQFSNFIGDGLEKLGTVVATFDKNQLIENGNVLELVQPLATPEMPVEMLADQVVAPLKENRNLFKLQIASDSMVALDQNQERQDTMMMLESAGAYFKNMQAMVQQSPAMLPFAIKLFEKMIRSFKGGKELEAVFIDTLNQEAQKAQAAMNQPPAPDPQLIESQNRMQIAQMEAQSKQAQAQVDMQKNQTELQIEQIKAQAEMQLEMAKGQLEEWKAMQDVELQKQKLMLDARKLEIDLIKIQSDAEAKAIKTQLDDKIATIDTLLQAQAMKLTESDKRIKQAEQLLEEQRLSRDTGIEQQKIALHMQELSIKKEELEHKKKESSKKPVKKIGSVSADGTQFEIKQVDDD